MTRRQNTMKRHEESNTKMPIQTAIAVVDCGGGDVKSNYEGAPMPSKFESWIMQTHLPNPKPRPNTHLVKYQSGHESLKGSWYAGEGAKSGGVNVALTDKSTNNCPSVIAALQPPTANARGLTEWEIGKLYLPLPNADYHAGTAKEILEDREHVYINNGIEIKTRIHEVIPVVEGQLEFSTCVRKGALSLGESDYLAVVTLGRVNRGYTLFDKYGSLIEEARFVDRGGTLDLASRIAQDPRVVDLLSEHLEDGTPDPQLIVEQFNSNSLKNKTIGYGTLDINLWDIFQEHRRRWCEEPLAQVQRGRWKSYAPKLGSIALVGGAVPLIKWMIDSDANKKRGLLRTIDNPQFASVLLEDDVEDKVVSIKGVA